MTDMVAHVRSKGVMNPRLNLSSVPPTDLSMASRRYVKIAPFNTGINPVDFQIDPQEDFIDLNDSFIELELVLKKESGSRRSNPSREQFGSCPLQTDHSAIEWNTHQPTDRHVPSQSVY